MSDPPDPGIPPLLLAAARVLGFLVTGNAPDGTELGVFLASMSDGTNVPKPLYVASAGAPGTALWRTADGTPAGFAPHVFSRATYNMLHGGTLASDGTVSYQGRSYRLRVWFNGVQLTAVAIDVTGGAAGSAI